MLIHNSDIFNQLSRKGVEWQCAWNQRFEIAENFANDCKKQQNDKIKQQIITYLPELSSYLVTALAGLEMDNLSHIEAK